MKLHFGPNILQNCNFSPVPKQSNILFFLLFCKAVPQFHEIAKRPSGQIQVQMPRKCSIPRGSPLLARRHTWHAIKGTQCQNSGDYAPGHKQKQKFSLHSVGSNSCKAQEHFTNPNRFLRSKLAQINGVFFQSALRGVIEPSSPSLILCNSSTRFIAESNKP